MITEEQQDAFSKFITVIKITNMDEKKIALVETQEKGTGRNVCLICCVIHPSKEDEMFTIVPMAELLVDDDIDRYERPK